MVSKFAEPFPNSLYSLPVTRVLCWSLPRFTDAEIFVKPSQALPAGSRPGAATGSRAGKEVASQSHHVTTILWSPAGSPPAGREIFKKLFFKTVLMSCSKFLKFVPVLILIIIRKFPTLCQKNYFFVILFHLLPTNYTKSLQPGFKTD